MTHVDSAGGTVRSAGATPLTQGIIYHGKTGTVLIQNCDRVIATDIHASLTGAAEFRRYI